MYKYIGISGFAFLILSSVASRVHYVYIAVVMIMLVYGVIFVGSKIGFLFPFKGLSLKFMVRFAVHQIIRLESSSAVSEKLTIFNDTSAYYLIKMTSGCDRND